MIRTNIIIIIAIFLSGCTCSQGHVKVPVRTMITPQSVFEPEAGFFEIPPEKIEYYSANHAQGSIGFFIQGRHYVYYINAPSEAERILATSALLKDIAGALTIQLKYEPYGLHRKITNMLLFYGNRTIPYSLSPQNEITDDQEDI